MAGCTALDGARFGASRRLSNVDVRSAPCLPARCRSRTPIRYTALAEVCDRRVEEVTPRPPEEWPGRGRRHALSWSGLAARKAVTRSRRSGARAHSAAAFRGRASLESAEHEGPALGVLGVCRRALHNREFYGRRFRMGVLLGGQAGITALDGARFRAGRRLRRVGLRSAPCLPARRRSRTLFR